MSTHLIISHIHILIDDPVSIETTSKNHWGILLEDSSTAYIRLK